MIGQFPARFIAERPNAHIANVGLGCGLSVAAILEAVQPDATLDVIEINPQVPAAQKFFWPALPYNYSDPRTHMHIADGFGYFAERKQEPLYDAVVIDMSWMHNMNATHLFSFEMYKNVRRNLKDDGILSVWLEESQPFSPLSLITYKTLKAVFPNVYVDLFEDSVVYHASVDRADIIQKLSPQAERLNTWLEDLAATAPLNRLDNLVMNRYKFSVFGSGN